MITKPSLYDAVAATQLWQWEGDSVRPGVLRNGGDGSTYPAYTMADFSQVDKRLPGMVDDLIKPSFSGNWLRLLFEYVSPIGLVLPNGPRVKNIESMTLDAAANRVRIECTDFSFRKSDDVRKPVGTRPRFVHVDKAWLDKRYPGWENRYIAALALGLEPSELTALVIDAAPAQKVSALPSIGFE